MGVSAFRNRAQPVWDDLWTKNGHHINKQRMLHFQDISHVVTWMVQPERIKDGGKKKKKKTGQGP